jgi:hypothetical protein
MPLLERISHHLALAKAALFAAAATNFAAFGILGVWRQSALLLVYKHFTDSGRNR